MPEPKLIPITKDTVIFARPDGWNYHLDRNCSMLQGGDFERLGYVTIKQEEVKKRHLRPCLCAYEGNKDRFKKVVNGGKR